MPGTTNTFGGSSTTEYGSLLPLYYPAAPGSRRGSSTRTSATSSRRTPARATARCRRTLGDEVRPASAGLTSWNVVQSARAAARAHRRGGSGGGDPGAGGRPIDHLRPGHRSANASSRNRTAGVPDAHNMARLDVHHHTYARLWRELPASLVLLFRIGLHIVERKAGMEPLVEPLGRERRLCARVLSSGRRRGCPQSVPAELEQRPHD